jgi:uncharacterized protein YjdB
MNRFRPAIALGLFLLAAVSAYAACPTTPPTGYLQVTYAGTNCSSNFYGGTCALAQPVEFTASYLGYGDPAQPCDVITWNYGDGTTETKPAGVMTGTHTYATAGNYQITMTVTNSLGSRNFFYYSLPYIAVADGYFQLYSSCCSSPPVNEGQPASFTVQRTASAGPASVQYATSNGSAVAGVNYAATSGTVTFAAGEVQKTVTVPTIDDGVYKPDTYFRMTLSNPSGGFLLRNYELTQTITDIDPRPLLGFESGTYTVSESAGSVDIRVLRSVVTSSTVSVAYQVQNSFPNATVASSGVLTFFAGETAKTISVPILPTSSYDGDRLIYLSLSNPTNGATFGPYPNLANATITVKDAQPEPSVTFNDLSVVEGNSGTSIVNATVTLSTPAGFDVYVRPSFIDGTARQYRDFYFSGYYVIIPAGQTTTSFPLQIYGNTTVEGNKRFTIGGTAGRDYCCSTISFKVQSGTGTILNDDASVSPTRLSIPIGDVRSITLNFGAAPASPQSVTMTSSDPAVATVPSPAISVSTAAASIDITGKSAGPATITTTLPAAYGGGKFTTEVYVYEGATLVLSPASVSVPAGGTATITASVKPALASAVGAVLKSAGTGKITIPDSIVIEPGQTTTFTITGVKGGSVQLTATLGADHGSAASFVDVDVIAAPTTPIITQVSPANGPAAGGTAVTISGANLRSECTIRFGGVPAANSSFVSASSMTATTPAHAPGAVDVLLACGADAFNFANGFTYLGSSATLSNVTPSFGGTGGNTLVKITGTNISSGCWPFFDGLAARTAIVNGPSEMIASTPAHAASGTVPVTLRCNGASAVALSDGFTYSTAAEPSPVITAVDPLVGSPGKSVTISGARFRLDDAVTFDSAVATVLSTSVGTHVVRVPELPLGKTSITVTDGLGHASTTGPIFTIVEPQPPQITTVTPATTRPGNEVTLDGNGFRPGYTFAIGDQPAAIVTMTYSRVVLRVPQLAPGSYEIDVINAASKIAAVGPQLKVLAAGLAVTRVTPMCAMTNGGRQMTITGAGFVSGATVTLDGAAASGAVVADAQTITLTLPALPAGTPRVVVTNPNGDSASLTNAFNVISPFDPNGCGTRARPVRH